MLVRIMQEYRFLTTFHNDMQEKRARSQRLKDNIKILLTHHALADQSVMTLYNPHNRMREMFKPSMAELGLCMYQVGLLIIMAPPDILRKRLSSLDIFFIISFQLDTLIQEHIPDLYVHFQSQVTM